jgi:hypothetical protein
MLAIIRPDDVNLPLLVHVAGAMLLVGALVLAGAALLRAAAPTGAASHGARFARLGFRALVLVGLPAFVVMRAGAEWVASREDLGDPGWMAIGYAVSDAGLLVMLVASFLAWRAARHSSGASGPGRAAAALTVLLIAAYLVTVWAMTAKPT